MNSTGGNKMAEKKHRDYGPAATYFVIGVTLATLVLNLLSCV